MVLNVILSSYPFEKAQWYCTIIMVIIIVVIEERFELSRYDHRRYDVTTVLGQLHINPQ